MSLFPAYGDCEQKDNPNAAVQQSDSAGNAIFATYCELYSFYWHFLQLLSMLILLHGRAIAATSCLPKLRISWTRRVAPTATNPIPMPVPILAPIRADAPLLPPSRAMPLHSVPWNLMPLSNSMWTSHAISDTKNGTRCRHCRGQSTRSGCAA